MPHIFLWWGVGYSYRIIWWAIEGERGAGKRFLLNSQSFTCLFLGSGVIQFRKLTQEITKLCYFFCLPSSPSLLYFDGFMMLIVFRQISNFWYVWEGLSCYTVFIFHGKHPILVEFLVLNDMSEYFCNSSINACIEDEFLFYPLRWPSPQNGSKCRIFFIGEKLS